MEEMIKKEFGKRLMKKNFAETCQNIGIKYEIFVWID